MPCLSLVYSTAAAAAAAEAAAAADDDDDDDDDDDADMSSIKAIPASDVKKARVEDTGHQPNVVPLSRGA